MRNIRGFTLIEICVAVMIVVLMLGMAVPSLQSVNKENRLRKTFDDFDRLARKAQLLSITERRSYLLTWDASEIVLAPEVPDTDEEAEGIDRLVLEEDQLYAVEFSAALTEPKNILKDSLFAKEPELKEWVFWPSGNCEPAKIHFEGREGKWTATYHPLTGMPELIMEL